MRKVFHFDSPRERHRCDAAMLWCFDNRFDPGFRKFLKRIGVVYSDPIKVAGGAKSLASPEPETDREFALAYFVDFEGIWDAEATSSQPLGGRDVA